MLLNDLCRCRQPFNRVNQNWLGTPKITLLAFHDLRVGLRLSSSLLPHYSIKYLIEYSSTRIGRVSYLIYVSMRHYVLTTSGDIIVCFHTAVRLSC